MWLSTTLRAISGKMSPLEIISQIETLCCNSHQNLKQVAGPLDRWDQEAQRPHRQVSFSFLLSHAFQFFALRETVVPIGSILQPTTIINTRMKHHSLHRILGVRSIGKLRFLTVKKSKIFRQKSWLTFPCEGNQLLSWEEVFHCAKRSPQVYLNFTLSFEKCL